MDLVEGINLEMLLTTLNSSDPLASKQPVVLNLLREVTVRGAGLWESKDTGVACCEYLQTWHSAYMRRTKAGLSTAT